MYNLYQLMTLGGIKVTQTHINIVIHLCHLMLYTVYMLHYLKLYYLIITI